MFAYFIRYLSWNETSFGDKTETVKQPIQRSSDALKWNELEMAAIQHTDNTKFIDRLRNQQPSNVIYQVLVGILELGTDEAQVLSCCCSWAADDATLSMRNSIRK